MTNPLFERPTLALEVPYDAALRQTLFAEYRAALQARGLRPRTQRNYTQAVRLLLQRYPETPPGYITTAQIQQHLAARPDSTRYNEFIHLAKFYGWLRDLGVLPDTPCTREIRPRKNGQPQVTSGPRQPDVPAQVLERLMGSIPEPEAVLSRRSTIAENTQRVLDAYRDRLQKLNFAETTQRNYAATLCRFFRYFPTVPLESLTPEHIERYLYSRALSPRSMWTELGTVRAFLTWCVKSQRLFKTHPCEGIERPRWKFRPRPAPTWAEFEAVQRQCRTVEETAMVETLYFTGLRVSELCGLRLRDTDLLRRRIRIVGKGDKERVVVFPARVTEVLEAHLGTRRAPDDWLWPSPRHPGYARGVSWTQHLLRRLGKAAGLPYRLHPHLLRHGFFRLLKTRGVPVEVAARLGGHAKIQTTVEIYGRMDEDDLQGHYDRQLAGLGGGGNG